MESTIDLAADTIDVRDIIARVEELETERDECMLIRPDGEEEQDPQGWRDQNTIDAEELDGLTAILDELKGYGGDEQWRGDWYPTALIRDDHFEDYARELASDIGAIERNAQWPNNHIDWTAAAEALQQDYSSVEIDGTDYWYR